MIFVHQSASCKFVEFEAKSFLQKPVRVGTIGSDQVRLFGAKFDLIGHISCLIWPTMAPTRIATLRRAQMEDDVKVVKGVKLAIKRFGKNFASILLLA